jgi:hypothetical protein
VATALRAQPDGGRDRGLSLGDQPQAESFAYGRGAAINPASFWRSMAIVALLLVTGIRQFRRMEKRFADVI